MEKLIIVPFFGDLGNQLYQYTFIKFVEKYTGVKCIVDDSYYWIDQLGLIELEISCDIKLSKLSALFTEDVWKEMVDISQKGIPIVQQLYSCDFEFTLLYEGDKPIFSGTAIQIEHKKLYKELMGIFSSASNIFIEGEFKTTVYLNLLGEKFLEKIKFPAIKESLEISTINKRYEELILLTDSVGIYYDINLLDKERIKKIKEYIKSKEVEKIKTVFFIFSNNIEYCIQNKEQLGIQDIECDYFFVEENKNCEKRYVDMKLMSLCKNLIISDSSFAQWGYYLNSFCEKEKIVIIE